MPKPSKEKPEAARKEYAKHEGILWFRRSIVILQRIYRSKDM
jgi:hypothetical protein